MAEATQFGRYLLVKKLASGGMAQVWLARQPGIEGFEKLLVIKQVLAHLADDENFITMFLDEARLAARLNHPNVVQVFDLGQEDESYFIAMEYIHGEDIRRLDRQSRRARKPIPVPLVCRIIADAAAGLHYAHSLSTEDGRPLGIVHRDVSPQNIIVTFEGGVKVVDFGIAKAADRANKTRAGVLKGKYAYMSPEQAAAKPLDARTDVFALGILLHELLTGQRLFKREGEVATLHAVVSCHVEPPSDLNPIVPPELDPIVMSALKRDPNDRLQSAGELQMALEDFLLSQRMPASSAHLRAYIRDLFAERLDIEAREGGPAGFLVQRGTGTSQSKGLLSPVSSSGTSRGQGQTSAERLPRDSSSASGTPSSAASPAPADSSVSPSPEYHRASSSLGKDMPDQEGEQTAGSATRLAMAMHRRRGLLLGAAGLMIFVVGFGGGILLLGDRDTEQEGEVPAHLSSFAPKSESGEGSGTRLPPEGAEGLEDPLDPLQSLVKTEPEEGALEDGPSPEPEPSDPADHGSDAAAQDDPAPPPDRPTAPATGVLRAQVSPSQARIEVHRGGRWREVGGRGLSLPAGNHRLRITLPDGARVMDNVQVVAGQARTYERSFSKGSLRVVLRPFGSGGEVRSAGRVLGSLPGPALDLYEGIHQVEVIGQGGQSVRERVVIRPGQQESLLVELE